MSAVEALDDLVAHRLHPALVNEGLRRRGRTWWSGDAASGWMLLAVARWKYNDRDRAQFTVMADIWPPGTWTVYAELNPWAASGSRPDLDDNAPLSAEPRDLRPTRYADRDWPWKIQVRPDPGLADEIVGYCLEHALPTARRLVDVDQALRSLSEQRGKWALIYACGILEHAAPGHRSLPRPSPRCGTSGPEILDRLTSLPSCRGGSSRLDAERRFELRARLRRDRGLGRRGRRP